MVLFDCVVYRYVYLFFFCVSRFTDFCLCYSCGDLLNAATRGSTSPRPHTKNISECRMESFKSALLVVLVSSRPYETF